MQKILRQIANYVGSTSEKDREVFSEEDLKEHLIQGRLEEISEELRMAQETEADCLCEPSRVGDLRTARQLIADLQGERAELKG